MKLQIVNVKPWRAWDKETNKAGDRLGTTYTVVRFKPRGPVLVDVKVSSNEIITADTVRTRYNEGAAVWADFSGYEEDAYARDNTVFYSATAADVDLDLGSLVID